MKDQIDPKAAPPDAPLTATRKPRGKPFQPRNKHGHGRPKGSLNKRTLVARELLEENGPAMIKKAQLMALNGDAQVLRTLLSYTLSRPKEPPFEIGPLRMSSNKQCAETVKSVLKKAFDGEITIDEANESLELLARGVRMIDGLKDADARAAELKRIREREKKEVRNGYKLDDEEEPNDDYGYSAYLS